jgi:serine/threonine protein kinase
MQQWNIGQLFGQYRLDRLIGEGGAGVVFRARHVRLGHFVAIKLLRPCSDSHQHRGRFLREGQALGLLHHPGIVRLLHADSLPDGTEYLVLEYEKGVALRQWLSSQHAPLPVAWVASVLAQVADALAYAHAQGVVHRDVKPENLLVRTGSGSWKSRASGESSESCEPHVVLIDFGLACISPDRVRQTLPWPDTMTQLDTAPGSRPGTPFYRAPELGQGLADTSEGIQEGEKTPALDAYALGVVGWELLTGAHPSEIEPTEVAHRLRVLRPDVPTALSGLVARLLSPSPRLRPQWSEVAAICRTVFIQGSQPRRASFFQKNLVQIARSLRPSMQGMALFFTVAACLLFVGWQSLFTQRTSVWPMQKQAISDTTHLVLTQPIVGFVSDDEIHRTLGVEPSSVKRIDITPMQQLGPKLPMLHEQDWSTLASRQTEAFRLRLLPALQESKTLHLSYFGLAPVPLGIHLGTLLGGMVPITLYQRHHKAGNWAFQRTGKTQDILIRGLPQNASTEAGTVVLRVSSSALVDPKLTRQVVPDPLAEVDVALRHPSPDALLSEADVLELGEGVRHALDEIVTSLPNTTVVHLFAAVPGAVSLRIGMVVNPNVHPPIQTYQFDRELCPSYHPALRVPIGQTTPEGETTMFYASHSILERRMEHFVDWLKPDPEKETDMGQRAHDIRDRIRAQAHADGLVVRSTPSAGSFAKNTGLRRHVTGGSDVEGQDVDVPFVVAARSGENQPIGRLLDRFQGYADRAYPQNPPKKSRTKSSIKLEFVGAKLSFDLVPMIEASEYGEGYQWLLRGDGTRRLTSLEGHNHFIKRRTDASNQRPGRVKFNECVRLLKWWREFRMNNDNRSIPGIPSLVVEMLAAHAFDQKGVAATYGETLSTWFDFLYGAVLNRKRIGFSDYQPPRGRRHAAPATWMVIDPVDPENNLTHDWIDQHVDELALWLNRGRDDLQRAIDLDRRNNPQESLHHLVRIFGTPFKHHCGD